MILLLGLFQLFLKNGRFLFILFYFAYPAQEPRISGQRASGQGAAGVNHLAVQGDDPEPVVELFGNGHSVVQAFRHRYPAQQGIDDALILSVKPAKPARNAHKAHTVLQARLLQHVSFNSGQGQKGSPSAVPLL